MKTTLLKGTLALALLAASSLTSHAVNFTADPDPENKVSELSQVTLTFTDATSVDFGTQKDNVNITATGDFNRGCTLDYGTNDNQITVSFAKISDEGEYTINFPADAITADSESVEAFTITYTVGQEVVNNATLTPAPGSVPYLFDVVYYNPDVEANLSIEYGKSLILTLPDGTSANLRAIYDYQVGNGKYRFQLQDLAIEPGEYIITVPESTLYYSSAATNWAKVYLPGGDFRYTVTGGELTKVTSTPSVEAPTTKLSRIELTFPDYDTVAAYDGLAYNLKTVPVWRDGAEMSATSFMLNPTYLTIEGNKVAYEFTSSVIEPGHYHMTLPEGGFLLGEDQIPSTPFVVEFDIVPPQDVAISITPEAGSTVNMLRSCVVTFPEIENVQINTSANIALLKVTNTEEGEKTIQLGYAYGPSAIQAVAETTNSFNCVFNGLATEDGDYRIRVTKDSFTFADGYNQEYSVDVKFEAPQAPEYAMTPDSAVAQDKLQSFVITFPAEEVVTLNTQLSNKTVTLYKGSEITVSEYGYIQNTQVSSTSDFTPVEGTTNSFSFKIGTAGFDAGDYILRIPAGLFLMGEDATNFSRQYDVAYQCTGEGFDKLEVTPAEPVAKLQDITIKYVNESEIFFQNSYPGFTLYKVNEGMSYDAWTEFAGSDNVSIEGNTLKIHLNNEYTDAGVYYIDITNYSLFMSDGTTASTPNRPRFTVDPEATESAVETLEAENTDARIFTITGLQVKDMTTPGIYIVGGKKIIVTNR